MTDTDDQKQRLREWLATHMTDDEKQRIRAWLASSTALDPKDIAKLDGEDLHDTHIAALRARLERHT